MLIDIPTFTIFYKVTSCQPLRSLLNSWHCQRMPLEQLNSVVGSCSMHKGAFARLPPLKEILAGSSCQHGVRNLS